MTRNDLPADCLRELTRIALNPKTAAAAADYDGRPAVDWLVSRGLARWVTTSGGRIRATAKGLQVLDRY
jgi:hypothetical protein